MPRVLVADFCNAIDVETVSVAATTRNLTRLAARAQKEKPETLNPKTLADLVFSLESVTINGKNCLLHDSSVSKPDADRIVIFGTADNLNVLAFFYRS